ncbi:TfoX/Sxy family protein [Aliiroseovarius sp. YM-037]|uniref:TfoX/Sxy family protein n=1 Tax=Aliiroseovarius sp. YM-037 TaxID=3341728 RepID=UPI003A80BFA9
MPYDEELAERLRTALDGLPDVEEKRMMGGVIFMVGGHMLGGGREDKDGLRRFMFRVGKDQEAAALSRPGAARAVMGTRQMHGFVYIDCDEVDDTALSDWVSMALGYIGTLPPNTGATK